MFASVRFSRRSDAKHRRHFLKAFSYGAVASLAFTAALTLATVSPLCARTNPGMFVGLEKSVKPAATKAIALPAPPPIIEIATTPFSTSPNAVYRRTSSGAAWALFAAAMALLGSLNLILISHLGLAYGPLRKRREKAN